MWYNYWSESYSFKNPETKYKINKNLSCNSENVLYIIECNECKEIYIRLTQALNTRTSLHKSYIKIQENRKLNVSKHLYQCSRGKFKIMPIYQNNEHSLLQIKERNFVDKFKPKLNKTWTVRTHKRKKETQTQTHTHTHTHTHKHTYLYIHKNICN